MPETDGRSKCPLSLRGTRFRCGETSAGDRPRLFGRDLKADPIGDDSWSARPPCSIGRLAELVIGASSPCRPRLSKQFKDGAMIEESPEQMLEPMGD